MNTSALRSLLGTDDAAVIDAWMGAARAADEVGVRGFGVVRLFIPETGETTHLAPFTNLLTTAGDEYYAKKVIVGISPANATAPTAATGMKYGTSTTAAAKSGAGGALVAYVTASNTLFDTLYPQVAAVGGDGGWNATYKATTPAGTATNATINEVVIVNDAAANATSTAANTYARAIITTVNKTAGEALAITWTHKILGA